MLVLLCGRCDEFEEENVNATVKIVCRIHISSPVNSKSLHAHKCATFEQPFTIHIPFASCHTDWWERSLQPLGQLVCISAFSIYTHKTKCRTLLFD